MIAARIGQLLNSRDLARDVGVSDVTVRKWIHALEVSGTIHLLTPFHANLGKRLVKSPKVYFADQGLACHLLDIDGERAWRSHPHTGNLWEDFVLMELVKTQQLTPSRNLYFYRDSGGVEIDFLVEKGRKVALVEAKVGERIDPRKFAFDKVVATLGASCRTRAVLAHDVDNDGPAQMAGYVSFNPLRTVFPLAETDAPEPPVRRAPRGRSGSRTRGS